MTKLIVRPIDPAQPGSYRERTRLLAVMEQMGEATQQGADIATVVAAHRAMREMVLGRLTTDNGTSVEDALDQLSANEFDDLFATLLSGGPSVPPASASGSSSGPEAGTRESLTG